MTGRPRHEHDSQPGAHQQHQGVSVGGLLHYVRCRPVLQVGPLHRLGQRGTAVLRVGDHRFVAQLHQFDRIRMRQRRGRIPRRDAVAVRGSPAAARSADPVPGPRDGATSLLSVLLLMCARCGFAARGGLNLADLRDGRSAVRMRPWLPSLALCAVVVNAARSGGFVVLGPAPSRSQVVRGRGGSLSVRKPWAGAHGLDRGPVPFPPAPGFHPDRHSARERVHGRTRRHDEPSRCWSRSLTCCRWGSAPSGPRSAGNWLPRPAHRLRCNAWAAIVAVAAGAGLPTPSVRTFDHAMAQESRETTGRVRSGRRGRGRP